MLYLIGPCVEALVTQLRIMMGLTPMGGGKDRGEPPEVEDSYSIQHLQIVYINQHS